MLNKHKISFFVPVFNEERILERNIKALDYILGKLPFDYEIFIVNDASKDKTEAISEKIRRENGKIKLLNYYVGPTRRENLAQSFKKAEGDIVAFADIDLVASFRFIPNLVNYIIEGYDIVAGSKYVAGAKIKRKPLRLFTSFIYNLGIALLFNTHIKDHLCGFKAFKKDVILKLVDEMGYDKSLQRGIFWDAELLIRAVRYGYRIKVIPIWVRDKNKTSLYFKREVKSLFYMVRFYSKDKT